MNYQNFNIHVHAVDFLHDLTAHVNPFPGMLLKSTIKLKKNAKLSKFFVIKYPTSRKLILTSKSETQCPHDVLRSSHDAAGKIESKQGLGQPKAISKKIELIDYCTVKLFFFLSNVDLK